MIVSATIKTLGDHIDYLNEKNTNSLITVFKIGHRLSLCYLHDIDTIIIINL